MKAFNSTLQYVELDNSRFYSEHTLLLLFYEALENSDNEIEKSLIRLFIEGIKSSKRII